MTVPPESKERFERLARITARALGTPMALVTLAGAERPWFSAGTGLAPPSASPSSLCEHVVSTGAPLVVEDAARDERFAGDPLVAGEPHIRFYAGHPLRRPGGEAIGALCVLDRAPRTPSDDDLAVLADLAAVGGAEVNARERDQSLLAMQDQFVRLAAHDLRTPLTSILGYSEMLVEGVAGDLNEKQRGMADVVLRNADRLRELVEDSLLVLRLEAGRFPLVRERADLAEVARAAARDVEPHARAAAVTIELSGEAATVDADPRLLQRATEGLLRRAVAESPSGSSVGVTTSAESDGAALAVTDAGRSLEPEELERVGERFYRDTAHDETGTTGLALTIARGVAEAHGGRMRVTSAGERGTTATVELPAG